MAREETEYYIFKKNVPYYNVGVRRSLYDTDGIMLTNEFPTVRIEEKDLRDFKRANKRVMQEGLVIQVEDEDLDWELVNDVSDEEVAELLKSYTRLKSTLQTLTSMPVVQKIYTTAVDQDKPKKTVSLIKARLDELTPDEDWAISKDDMQGTDVER